VGGVVGCGEGGWKGEEGGWERKEEVGEKRGEGVLVEKMKSSARKEKGRRIKRKKGKNMSHCHLNPTPSARNYTHFAARARTEAGTVHSCAVAVVAGLRRLCTSTWAARGPWWLSRQRKVLDEGLRLQLRLEHKEERWIKILLPGKDEKDEWRRRRERENGATAEWDSEWAISASTIMTASDWSL
jgi:hypothetical protein